MIKPIALTVASLAFVSAHAASLTFTVGGANPAAQVFTVDSEAQFENFTGRTNEVSGAITFDPAKKSGSGKFEINLGSIDTGIPLRNDHMKSEGWLNTTKYPNATFQTTSVKFVSGDKYKVTGKLSLHGITKTITTDATVKYIKASDVTKKAHFNGDVLQVKTSFPIKLADFGIKIPDIAKGKVGETVNLRLTAFATTG